MQEKDEMECFPNPILQSYEQPESEDSQIVVQDLTSAFEEHITIVLSI